MNADERDPLPGRDVERDEDEPGVDRGQVEPGERRQDDEREQADDAGDDRRGTSRATRASAPRDAERGERRPERASSARCGAAGSGPRLASFRRPLAEQALGPEDEDQDQDREDDRLRPVAPGRVPVSVLLNAWTSPMRSAAEHGARAGCRCRRARPR